MVGKQDLSMGTQRRGTKDPKEYAATCRRGEAVRAILTERGGGRGGETREDEAQTLSRESGSSMRRPTAWSPGIFVGNSNDGLVQSTVIL